MNPDHELTSQIADFARNLAGSFSTYSTQCDSLYLNFEEVASKAFAEAKIDAVFIQWSSGSDTCRALEARLSPKYAGKRLGYLKAPSPTNGFDAYCVFYVDCVATGSGCTELLLRRCQLTNDGAGDVKDIDHETFAGQLKQVVEFGVKASFGFVPTLRIP